MQQRIAGILTAYNELMENCQRRIRILEAMARALYREWFVHFRFPNHEKFPCVDSRLGPIPKGWEIKPLFDLAEVKYGKNLPTKLLSDNSPYPVYGAAKVIGRHTDYTREQRTIICGCRGSVGEMQITLAFRSLCFVTRNRRFLYNCWRQRLSKLGALDLDTPKPPPHRATCCCRGCCRGSWTLATIEV